MSDAWRSIGIGCVATLAIVVGCGPSVSDTGYVGTWRRSFGEQARSEVAFWKTPDGTYRFRANRFGADGTHELRCGAEGPCLEYGKEPEPFYEYHYRAFERPGETGLFVDCEGRPHGTHEATPLQQVERFVLAPGGLVLEVRLVEQNHVVPGREVVRARFNKVSNDPFE